MGRLLAIAACWLMGGVLALAPPAFAPRAFAEPGPVTTSLDLRALPEATYQKLDGVALERRVMMRLVQEGFAVVSLEVGGHVRLRLRQDGPRTLVLTIVDRDGERSRTIPLGQEPTEELHLELAQKAAELARPNLVRRPLPAEPIIGPDPAKQPKPIKAEKLSPTQTRSGSVDGQAGAALLYRSDATDPLFWGALRIGVYGGLGVHLLAGVAPASSGRVTATEVQLQVGVGYRHALGARVDLEAALLLGGLVHHFSVANTTTDQSGTRVNFLATLPVTLQWWALDHVALGLRVAAGLADAGRTHTENGTTLWKRNDFRLEAGLGLTVRFR